MQTLDIMKNAFKFKGLVVLILIIMLSSCKMEELPTVSTDTIMAITTSSASGGGNITSDGGTEVIARGVCWSLNENPSTFNTNTIDGDGTGQFSSTISGLKAGHTYHVRAYATNSVGTAYGNDRYFVTLGQIPDAITHPPITISDTFATLRGLVNANNLSTTVKFEYGLTTSYGMTAYAIQNPLTGNILTTVSTNIAGLTSGNTYHYRIIARNSMGVIFANNVSFTTR